MSYLRFTRNKIQSLAETVASVLNVEVAVADKNLTRIVGTGKFYDVLGEECADDSIFAKVIESGEYAINLNVSEDCKRCSGRNDCAEFANMTYPIKVDGNIQGVVSFASFDEEQRDVIKIRKNEYFNMLKETAWIIEQEIINVHVTNKLKKEVADINEIINCLNKGIIILNEEKEILHINNKALDILSLSLSEDVVIDKNIINFIDGIKYEETNMDRIGIWKTHIEDIRVVYGVNKIIIGNNEPSIMISFDVMDDIIKIARDYGSKEKIKFENIIGKSDSILRAIEKSKVAAKTDSTILLLGDSGTGKELFARSIHNESNRSKGPFVVINCGSIPENLIESELFGYEKGAFTGADLNGKKGKIELANNGTLFLDEIGDLPLHLQTRLLRVLQERNIMRLGGDRPIDINIRVISATNKNLIELVKSGDFRLDLYYRLNVIPIELPPLKEREDDVLLCADYIIEELSEKMNIKPKKLSNEVINRFKEYDWYGNVRELENILEHGICFSRGEYIELESLPEYFINNEFSQLEDDKKDNIIRLEDYGNKNLEELKQEFERFVIEDLLNKYGDDTEGKKKVAKELNIGLTTLYRKLNE